MKKSLTKLLFLSSSVFVPITFVSCATIQDKKTQENKENLPINPQELLKNIIDVPLGIETQNVDTFYYQIIASYVGKNFSNLNGKFNDMLQTASQLGNKIEDAAKYKEILSETINKIKEIANLIDTDFGVYEQNSFADFKVKLDKSLDDLKAIDNQTQNDEKAKETIAKLTNIIRSINNERFDTINKIDWQTYFDSKKNDDGFKKYVQRFYEGTSYLDASEYLDKWRELGTYSKNKKDIITGYNWFYNYGAGFNKGNINFNPLYLYNSLALQLAKKTYAAEIAKNEKPSVVPISHNSLANLDDVIENASNGHENAFWFDYDFNKLNYIKGVIEGSLKDTSIDFGIFKKSIFDQQYKLMNYFQQMVEDANKKYNQKDVNKSTEKDKKIENSVENKEDSKTQDTQTNPKNPNEQKTQDAKIKQNQGNETEIKFYLKPYFFQDSQTKANSANQLENVIYKLYLVEQTTNKPKNVDPNVLITAPNFSIEELDAAEKSGNNNNPKKIKVISLTRRITINNFLTTENNTIEPQNWQFNKDLFVHTLWNVLAVDQGFPLPFDASLLKDN
ncbi:hypothetical protein [Mesomycoplasma bovoculi]|uniref:Putative lipoprotein n=1 Tax=Mesomycoplasma bovoculi M165/69 TaxID=743966 RepID=W5USP2_9BACT|nr:hypothetical protein [Mesomycoplasma bovoculi]AHH45152.1 putative lipoprotein [Mesomycoplasma bovoculi M165/69]